MPKFPGDRALTTLGNVFGVYTLNKDSELRAVGTGWVYKLDESVAFFVTAAHVLKDSESTIWLKHSSSHSWLKANLVGSEKDSDIALLIAPLSKSSPSLYAMPQRQSKLIDTEKIYTRGFCQECDDYVTSRGYVTNASQSFSVSESHRICRFIQICMTVEPGMSGAPVVDKEGQLTGMIVKKYLSFGLALPLDAIETGIRVITGLGKSRIPNFGMTITPSIIVHEISESVIAGLRIASIEKEGLAEKSGFLTGDIIVSINDEPTTGKVCELYESLSVNDKTNTLHILRKGRLFSVNVSF